MIIFINLGKFFYYIYTKKLRKFIPSNLNSGILRNEIYLPEFFQYPWAKASQKNFLNEFSKNIFPLGFFSLRNDILNLFNIYAKNLVQSDCFGRVVTLKQKVIFLKNIYNAHTFFNKLTLPILSRHLSTCSCCKFAPLDSILIIFNSWM